MKMLVWVVSLIALISIHVEARVFSRCQLARELKRQGITEKQLANWVCLVESESSRNTSAVGGPNSDGSYDWGLYQINDRYWCGKNEPAGSCYVACDSLITDDIKTATRCALKIYRIHNGFTAWVGWVNRCQGQLPDVSACFKNHSKYAM